MTPQLLAEGVWIGGISSETSRIAQMTVEREDPELFVPIGTQVEDGI